MGLHRNHKKRRFKLPRLTTILIGRKIQKSMSGQYNAIIINNTQVLFESVHKAQNYKDQTVFDYIHI
jgi:hypothetical protein